MKTTLGMLLIAAMPAILSSQTISLPPSGVSGIWQADGSDWRVALRTEGPERLLGTVSSCASVRGALEIFDGTVNGNTITFRCRSGDGARTITLRGIIQGDHVTLTWDKQAQDVGNGNGVNGPTSREVRLFDDSSPRRFTATRVPDRLLLTSLAATARAPIPCIAPGSQGDNAAAGHYAISGRVRIYYETYGAGPALLILHGNGGSIRGMACQVDFFSRTHRVIAIDSRGHGKSDDGTGALTFEQMADDVVAVLDAEHVERADVLGFSDGGNLVLELGIHHPDRVLKLAAAGPSLSPDALGQRFIESVMEDVAEANRMIAAGDASRDWVRRKRVLELDLYKPRISLEAVRSVAAPTLVIGSDGDQIPLEHLVEIYHALPHGQLFIRPGAPHNALNDRELGAVFNAAVETFLVR